MRKYFPYEVADDETLEVTMETASLTDYEDAIAVMEQYGDELDPAAYGAYRVCTGSYLPQVRTVRQVLHSDAHRYRLRHSGYHGVEDD